MPTVNGLKVTDPDGRLLGYQATCPFCGTQVRAKSCSDRQVWVWRSENRCRHYVVAASHNSEFEFEFEEMPEPEDDLTAAKRYQALEEER